MNRYTVVPDKDVKVWFLKVENTAPVEEYDKKDKAVNAGEEMAKQNTPSTLEILDKNHELVEERKFQE